VLNWFSLLMTESMMSPAAVTVKSKPLRPSPSKSTMKFMRSIWPSASRAMRDLVRGTSLGCFARMFTAMPSGVDSSRASVA